MEEIPEDKAIRYSSFEALPRLEELLGEIGISRAENQEQLRQFEAENRPYFEVIGRINTALVRKLRPDQSSLLETRIGEYNAACRTAERVVIEAVGRVYKHSNDRNNP